MTKFCKDCKWFSPADSKDGAYAIEYARCMNPATTEDRGVNLVTGEPYPPKYHFAEHARWPTVPCGRDGNLFEPKEAA
jgi:hypothetical protein